MPHDNVWVFVDDKIDEAKSFAEELQRRGAIKIEVLGPDEARSQLLRARRHPAGVLMDVDLSAIASEPGTGPGIAQDIRTKQKAQLACEFPIVRFSAADPVARNVLGDPSSEDLFESKILKDDVEGKAEIIISQLNGLTTVYDSMIFLSENLDKRAELLPQIFGLDTATLADWMHEGLVAKMLTGASHAPHVAAGAFCRLFLIPHGILVDERLLSVRLGVDTSACMDSWNALLEKFSSFCYRGAASEFFPRWWARGLEDWWFKNVDKSGPLAGKTATERVGLLAQTTGILGLVALPVPVGEQDFRPWRLCRLALEASPQQFIPVDPAQSVRVTPQADFPPWVEPHSASAKLALRARDDQRLNRKDVERLRKKYGV